MRTAHGAVLMVLVAVRAAILGAAIAGAAVKYGPSGPDGRRLLPLDLVAGWSLLAAAWARHVTGGCRALLGPTEVIWFLATPQVVGGAAGHAQRCSVVPGWPPRAPGTRSAIAEYASATVTGES